MRIFPGLVSLLAFATIAPAQTPSTPPLVVSPEVQADRRVTFRLAAPTATTVALRTDWLADALPLTKTPDGVWSITLGPLAPSTYIYSFTVDGIAMADPVNPRMKLRMRGSGSLVDVPGGTPTLADSRDVPHGDVQLNWQKSTVLGDVRQVWVYTPPGYAQERDRRYPVLYLCHGNNDRPAGWVDVGHVNFIADNLIAEKKMAPMVIVMPVGHALPFGQPPPPGRTNLTAFEDYLLRDVMPLVETKYRVAAGRRNCAIAGMSMGGEQALHLFLHHLDRFAAGGVFSLGGNRDLEKDHATALATPATTNAAIDVLWLACGRQDPGFSRSEKATEILTARGIRHTWYPTEGAHNYALWREHLIEFMPLLFRESEKKL